MKVSIFMVSSVIGHSQGPHSRLWKHEWQLQKAYFERDPKLFGESKQRDHTYTFCGEPPLLPSSEMEVHCWDQYCGAICPKGWKSENRWRIKCKYNAGEYDWTHKQFSPCITCPDISEDLEKLGTKNVEFTESNTWWGRSYAFQCNDSSETDYILSIKGEIIKKGNIKKGETKKVNCKCKKRPKEAGGRPNNKKGGRFRTCKWVYKKSPWTTEDTNTINCSGRFSNLYILST